ncbi:MAG: FkbM family methyltransferase [Victivallaceae bacterium]|nr:FkbM family methyltransferase [Victivallaceae bacterium]
MFAKAAKLLYPVIELLPDAAAAKIKILIQVLFRDWRYFQRVGFPHAGNFAGAIPDDWEKGFPGLDSSSMEEVGRFLRKIRTDLAVNCPDLPDAMFLVWRKMQQENLLLPPPPDRKLCELRKRYGLDGGAESLVFRQGVALLSEAMLRSLSGTYFVDAGAYVGNYAIPLMEYEPECLFAFEPNRRSAATLEANMRRCGFDSRRYEVHCLALGENFGHVAFDDSGIRLDVPGTCHADVVSLDGFFRERTSVPVGLIKADVEGMGLALLRGAAATIRRCRPVLALACYHSPEELFGQYRWLCENVPDYQIRITALPPGSGYELSILAVPKEGRH